MVEIDHQEICMTDSGYNQVLVMIDHFLHEVCRGRALYNCLSRRDMRSPNQHVEARHCCPMTFQSDNGTAFVGELTKELMRRSQVAQVHSTTYHPQTIGLVEKQNRTLVSM